MEWEEKLSKEIEADNMNDFDGIEAFIRTQIIKPLIDEIPEATPGWGDEKAERVVNEYLSKSKQSLTSRWLK